MTSKKIKRVSLVFGAFALLMLLGACRKNYKCRSEQSSYVVCNISQDTVRYYVTGGPERTTRVKNYYENLGYSCSEVPGFMGGISETGVISAQDAKYLEAQGYYCYQYQGR